MTANAKKQLVDLVVRRALEPVLHAKLDGRSDAERRKLERVQDATRVEIERFRRYGSAAEVITNFRRDLTSQPAKKLHRDLRSLDLPTLDDIRDEFERKAAELGA